MNFNRPDGVEMNTMNKPFERDGKTLYELNEQGSNLFTIQIQPGQDNNYNRTSDEKIKEVTNLLQAAPIMLAALKMQELLKTFQNEDQMPLPNDPRYTPYIGEWNGYQAPEVRFQVFCDHRRNLRRQAFAIIEGK